MKIYISMAIIVLTALFTASIVVQEAPPAADHHMHMRSEAMAKAINRAVEKVNEPVPPGPFSPQGAAEVLAALDSAGVARAAVLSSAYLFGMPDVGFENQQASVMAENDYVSREVAKHRERLVGFCSVNPLAEYAMSEVTRCSTLPGMVGLKLHFANSDVDLRNRVLSVPSLDVSHALSADIFRRHARSPKGHKLIAENLEPCGMR